MNEATEQREHLISLVRETHHDHAQMAAVLGISKRQVERIVSRIKERDGSYVRVVDATDTGGAVAAWDAPNMGMLLSEIFA
jgi:malonyl CoA-acyl carrier protein transacylase